MLLEGKELKYMGFGIVSALNLATPIKANTHLS